MTHLPGYAGICLPLYVSRLGKLLRVIVSRKFLEQKVVKALFIDEALDGDDAWLHALHHVKGGGGDGQAVLKLGHHLHAGEVQVEGDAALHGDGVVHLPPVPLVKQVLSLVVEPAYSAVKD